MANLSNDAVKLGSVYFDLERFEEARAPLARATAVQERIYRPDHVSLGSRDLDFALSLQHYSLVLRNLGRDDEADALDARVSEVLE